MTYHFDAFENIIRDSDGASIPQDEANRDYADYLAWVAEGNTATPYVAPPLTPQQQIDAIERAEPFTQRMLREWLIQTAIQAGMPAAFADPTQPLDTSAQNTVWNALPYGLQQAVLQQRTIVPIRAEITS